MNRAIKRWGMVRIIGNRLCLVLCLLMLSTAAYGEGTGGRLLRTATEQYLGTHVGVMAVNTVPALSRSYFDGGYFDAEGKVHYFVTDCQGNVVEDRKARGAVVASTQYYLYGEPWTEPAGDNDRWFGGKERLAPEGLPMSDFGPRLLNTPYPAWISQDRKLEDYYHLSPYSYCAGNPIVNIDPDGNDWYRFMMPIVNIVTEQVERYEPLILYTECRSQTEMDEKGIHGESLGHVVMMYKVH